MLQFETIYGNVVAKANHYMAVPDGCGAIADDNKCVSIEARKHIDRDRPRVRFALVPLEPTLF